MTARSSQPPKAAGYDVVIVGGAIMGSSVAWFLASNPDFDGSILVVERDPSYEFASTTHTNSCMRQQFGTEINVRISQFGAQYLRDIRSQFDDPDVPEIGTRHFGYLYLADTEAFAAALRQSQEVQARCGAATYIMTPEQIAAEYPFYNLDGILCGSHNRVDEGYFDGGTLFDVWRTQARRAGVEYCTNEVVALTRTGQSITSVTLASGETVACGAVVNAAGPRAVEVSRMAGFDLPVEPRRRFTFVFDAAEPLDRDLPLTIDPSGVHVRTDGGYYMAGCGPDPDPAAAYDDFTMDNDIWEDKVWPVLAERIPAFERVKVLNRWVGHYAYNTLDQNAIVGPHPEVTNFVFCNGFSGHGLQQSPAMGRGVSEWLAYGHYRSLDLSPLGYQRILDNEPFLERAVI
jgi:glycine/D-amino acid oxidase-like deaminating enzyme